MAQSEFEKRGKNAVFDFFHTDDFLPRFAICIFYALHSCTGFSLAKNLLRIYSQAFIYEQCAHICDTLILQRTIVSTIRD